MRAALTAATAFVAVLSLASAASAQHAATDHGVLLPPNVWAVELGSSTAVPSTAYTAKLRAAGVNAVVVDAATFTSKHINGVRASLASSSLVVLVSTTGGRCASVKAPLVCSQRASSIPTALRMARAGAMPTIVHIPRSDLLNQLKGARGRVVAVVPYATVTAHPAAWKQAIALARSSKMLDLAIGLPKTSNENPFPGLKTASSVPPPAAPPGPVQNLHTLLVGPDSAVLAWDQPALEPADHYELFASDVSVGTSAVTSATFAGLSCGASVTLGVDAVAADAQHSSRATLTVVPPCAPGGPDTTPPVAAIVSGPATTTSATTAGFSFAANEPSTFACSLDGAAYTTCTSPVSYSSLAVGSHTFGVRPTDAASNVGAVAARSWTVDLAPHTTVTGAPTNPTTATSASFSFTSDRAGSTFRCKLDGAAFSTCVSPATYSSLAAGSHAFQVQATDLAGTTEAVPATYTWVVSALPETTITARPSSTSGSASAQFSFTSTDAAATFECKLDGSAFVLCSTPKAYSGLSVGAHTFQVRSTGAGGTDATPDSYTWTVDTTAPTVTVSSGPANPTTATTALLGFFASELSTFECSLDTGAFVSCTSPASYSSVSAGAHTFRVRATDVAGNVSAPASYNWTVTATTPDTTAPTVPGSLAASGATQTSITLSWAASTDGVGVAGYSVYQGSSTVGSSPTPGYTVSGLACGTSYTLAADAYDAAGNRSAKAQISASTSACPTGSSVLGNVFMSASGNDSGANCRRFTTQVTNPGGVVCLTIGRAYNLASKGDTVVMAGGTYGGQLRTADAAAKGATGGGCDRYAGDTAGCVNFVPDSGAAVSWSPGAEIRIEVPYVHLKGLTIPSGPYGDVYAGVNDTSTNIKGIWLDAVDIPQFFATNLDGFAITDSRVGPCVTSPTYTTCDSQIKGGYLAPDAPGLEHNILIDNVTFHDTWRTGTQDHLECLLVFDAKNITVRNSAFQNCGIIDFFLASTSGHPLTGALVENTVFDAPGSHGPTSPSNQTSQGLLVSCQSSTCSNITVRNNSFVAGAQMIAQATSGSFVGSITYTGNASGGSTICQSFTTYSYNLFNGSSCGSQSWNANPGFLSPATNPVDLRVGAASPVAARGNPGNAPATDRAGRPRPSSPAAGAYEAG